MRKALLLLFLLQFFVLAFSAYYADLSIIVGKDGGCEIKGITNHPRLSEGVHYELTYKEGIKWKFVLDINEKFSDFVYEIHMPQKARITKISNSGLILIQASDNTIIINGTGKEEPLRLYVEYYIENDMSNNTAFLLLILSTLVLAAFLAYYLFKSKKASQHKETTKTYEGLSERQCAIMLFLENKGGEATQKDITNALGLPKSSVSRNIEALLKKGYVKREQRGMSNYIRINRENE
ncbi:MAG: MarR family transcriptional regulator [Candidatus Diapherotrites archaeon]|nr:MarR family transcriptional regulator [Candidatus Diapherotrites archaeon]